MIWRAKAKQDIERMWGEKLQMIYSPSDHLEDLRASTKGDREVGGGTSCAESTLKSGSFSGKQAFSQPFTEASPKRLRDQADCLDVKMAV